MSTTTHLPSSAAPAPWRQSFLQHLSKMPTPQFVLSTVAPAPPGSAVPFVPRARYCIFRGLWAELPADERNQAPRNPAVFASDLPCFTTDVRMDKVGELFATGPGHGQEAEGQTGGSGGGGPVEAVWWAEEVGSQWRVKGRAYVVCEADVEAEGKEERSGVRTVKGVVGGRMRVVEGAEGRVGEWSWKREVVGHFGNMSPGMRGSFRGPPPGRPVSENPNPSELQVGTQVETLDDPIARSQFRVVVIVPDEVEQTDLSDPSKARRRRWSWDEQAREWRDEGERWP